MSRRIALLLGATLLSIGIVGVTCGGDDERTLEEFFHQADAIDDDFQQRFDRLSDEHPGRSLPGDERVQPYKAYLGAFTVLFAEFLDELETLNPPSEAEDVFEDLLVTGREDVDSFREFGDRLEGIESLAELYDFFDEGMAEATTNAPPYLIACESFQELADANGIVVSFDCGIFRRAEPRPSSGRTP